MGPSFGKQYNLRLDGLPLGKKEGDNLMAFISGCFKNMLMGVCLSTKQGIWMTYTLDLEGNVGLGSKRCMRSDVRWCPVRLHKCEARAPCMWGCCGNWNMRQFGTGESEVVLKVTGKPVSTKHCINECWLLWIFDAEDTAGKQTAKNFSPHAVILVEDMVMNQINKEICTLRIVLSIKGEKKIREGENTKHQEQVS